MAIAIPCTLAFKHFEKDAIPLMVMADKGAAWGKEIFDAGYGVCGYDVLTPQKDGY